MMTDWKMLCWEYLHSYAYGTVGEAEVERRLLAYA